jgi:hypothetical protein
MLPVFTGQHKHNTHHSFDGSMAVRTRQRIACVTNSIILNIDHNARGILLTTIDIVIWSYGLCDLNLFWCF